MLELLVAAPDDDELRLVYADALQQRGDPHGELIALHAQLRRNPTDAVRDRARVLERQLAPPPRAELELEWHLGFVAAASFGVASITDPIDAELELLDDVLARPTGALVRALRFRRVDFAAWLARLIELGPRPALRTLEVGTIEDRGDGFIDSPYDGLPYITLGDLGALWPLVPHLRELLLVGGGVSLGESLVLPELRRFEARTMAIGRQELAVLTAARWPRLEHVHIDIGTDSESTRQYVARADRDAFLASLADGRLRHLGLENGAPIADLCTQLRDHPATLRNVRVLDLTSYLRAPWTGDAVDALVALRPALPALEILNVVGSYALQPEHLGLVRATYRGCTVFG